MLIKFDYVHDSSQCSSNSFCNWAPKMLNEFDQGCIWGRALPLTHPQVFPFKFTLYLSSLSLHLWFWVVVFGGYPNMTYNNYLLSICLCVFVHNMCLCDDERALPLTHFEYFLWSSLEAARLLFTPYRRQPWGQQGVAYNGRRNVVISNVMPEVSAPWKSMWIKIFNVRVAEVDSLSARA